MRRRKGSEEECSLVSFVVRAAMQFVTASLERPTAHCSHPIAIAFYRIDFGQRLPLGLERRVYGDELLASIPTLQSFACMGKLLAVSSADMNPSSKFLFSFKCDVTARFYSARGTQIVCRSAGEYAPGMC